MKLGYIILYVPDVQRAVDFYLAAFDVEPRFVHESGMYAELETGAATLAFAQEDFSPTAGIFTPNRPAQPAAGAEIAFVTADVEAHFRRALSAGAKSAVEPVAKTWGQTVAYVRDLNGFLVEICTPMGN